MIEIRKASTPEEFANASNLIREFSEWHRASHESDLELIKKYFDEKAFDAELSDPSKKYVAVLIAFEEEDLCGCVALVRMNEDDCEMKRMFVRPSHQRKGIGHALGEAILAEARAMGFKRMLLDTSIHQKAAQSLYAELGFTRRSAYYEMPQEVEDWLVFMEQAL